MAIFDPSEFDVFNRHFPELTPKENQYLFLAAQGFPRKTIGTLCGVSTTTVSNTLYGVAAKFGVCGVQNLLSIVQIRMSLAILARMPVPARTPSGQGVDHE